MPLYRGGVSMQWVTNQRTLVHYKQTFHINCLEFLAVTLAIQTITNEKPSITVLLKLENTTAMTNIYRRRDSITYAIINDKGPVAMVYGRNISINAQEYSISLSTGNRGSGQTDQNGNYPQQFFT